ncbi:GGDEF domain-containing protein [Lysobacter silvisoli]|uniref:diguanylate cyclase n=2 Tax=Lysobacter silvisoli TaxID=2293254 RepID=A0A371JYM4_9GAMM|nr:GGDEF domain-containing protein [Lysobacter silvisoli]
MNRDGAAPTMKGGQFNTDPIAAPNEAATAALSQAEFELFAELGRPRAVEAGQVLFRRGELGTTMFIVASGAIDLDFGDDLVTKRLGPREFFGELGLLIGDHARSADAIVAGAGLLIELRHEEFQRLVDRNPGLVCHFLRRAIMRVVLNEQGLIRRLRRRNQDLEAALDSLYATTHQLNQTEELIRTDELTGLYNRRGLTLRLQESRAIGMPASLGLVLVDCDRFKQVNDDHGHLAGDRVLQAVASILRSVAGPEDVACRLGGDEFCLLVASSNAGDVMRFAEFIVATAQNLMLMPQSPPAMCPVSVGACMVDPRADWNDWYARADEALYQAKRKGGNRVHWQDAALEPV